MPSDHLAEKLSRDLNHSTASNPIHFEKILVDHKPLIEFTLDLRATRNSHGVSLSNR